VTARSRSFSAAIVAVWAALAAGAGAPAAAAAPGDPDVATADAAIVVDASDGAVMFTKRAGDRRAIASTTKLMTALLTLERARPSQVFTAPRYNASAAESKINLSAGERMRVSDLLEALLLESANDAAETIAENLSGSRAAFVAAMNERAGQLGLRDTRYANPIGLDDPDNYSTARDLARLARVLMSNRRFSQVVNMPEAVLESGSRRRVVDNRNDLVARYEFVDGIKTGHTSTAGYLLIGAAHAATGGRVITVVMGEPSEAARDADTLALMRWGLQRFRSVPVLDKRRKVASVPVEHRDEPAALVPRRALTLTVRRGQRLERRVHKPASLEGPLPAGRRVGSVTIVRGGHRVDSIGLVTASAVPGPGALTRLFDAIGLPLVALLALGMVIAVVLAAQRLRGRLRLVRER
jgi:serine-type D-Ala-D-Ala carboxypeptidase (penicillin-binding protein 5/6)